MSCVICCEITTFSFSPAEIPFIFNGKSIGKVKNLKCVRIQHKTEIHYLLKKVRPLDFVACMRALK